MEGRKMNKVILSGNIATPVESKVSVNGYKVANFNLAVSKPYKVRDGEKDADFFYISAFKNIAQNCEQYLGVGDRVTVEGRLQPSTYEKNGVKMHIINIIAERIEFNHLKKRDEDDAKNQSAGKDFFSVTEEDAEEVPLDFS